MRLVVHDFGGYPFIPALSRALARRGHEVAHVYCASLPTTPQGGLARRADDPPGLTFVGIELPGFSKTNLARRFFAERRYGRLLSAWIQDFRPDVVFSADTPLDAQAPALRATHAAGGRFVFWLQDLIGEATYRLLAPRIPVVGALAGHYYRRLEARLLRRSDAVVAITEDFLPVLRRMGVAPGRVQIVENWAPLDDVPVHAQANPWSEAHGLAGKAVLLYAGTLGMKHDPGLLVALAEAFRGRADVQVVVASQGRGADYLRVEAETRGLSGLRVIGFQPFERVPEMLGAATVLLCVLEPDASVFSVPSKVLSYLCAGRPLLLSVPAENLAARIVARERAGRVVPPGDGAAFVDAARALLADPVQGAAMGAEARRYAEKAFDIERIADRFEALAASLAPPE